MFYFLYGDTPLPIKYEDILKEIRKENPNISTKIFEGSQNEEEQFLEALSINSMFVNKELIILKRAEKIKKLDSLLKMILDFDLSKKEIIITYEEELDSYNRTISPVGKRVLTNAEKLGKVIEARKVNEKKVIDFFIEKELNISEYEAEKLSEILGDDFFKVKNEVEKIKNFLSNEEFSLEKILPILTLTKEYNIKKAIEEFLKTKNFNRLLENLEETKEYMLFIYLIYEELNIILKLNLLKETLIFPKNISYNEFKSKIYPKIKKYFKKSVGYISEYPLFLKLEYTELYEQDFLLKTIENLLKLEYMIKNGKIEEKIGVEKFILSF